MQAISFSCHEERAHDSELRVCWQQSKRLLEVLGRQTEIYCSLCDSLSKVQCSGDGFDPREQLCCGVCNLNARIRAGISLLEGACPEDGRIYMTEQATPAFAWMQRRYPHLLGSEFQEDDLAREKLGEYLSSLGGQGPVMFQDVTTLSFEDASFDAVLSFDVLEHVADFRAALREFARVIKPGGALIATYPFTDGAETMTRARMREDGTVEHLHEPEYHGDPISGGVLCFYHFGWDTLKSVREAGFSSARMVMPWAPQQGLFYGLWTLLAHR